MTITETELKENISKYLQLSATEDIFISKNGKIIAKLSDSFADRIKLVESLAGILPANITLEESREERLNRI